MLVHLASLLILFAVAQPEIKTLPAGTIDLKKLGAILPAGARSKGGADLTLSFGATKVTIHEVDESRSASVDFFRVERALFLILPQYTLTSTRNALLAVDEARKTVSQPIRCERERCGQFGFHRVGERWFVTEEHTCGCAGACWVMTSYEIADGRLHRKKAISCNCEDSCAGKTTEQQVREVLAE